MMETMIPPQVGMRLWMKRKKEAKKEERAQIKKIKRPNIKKRKAKQIKKRKNKDRRDIVTILFPHLCFKVAP